MEATLSICKISHSFAPMLNTKPHQIQKKLWQKRQRACVLVMDCAKSGGVSFTEMEAKIKLEQDSEFVIEGKCQGKKGIVELIECLESEAIMGEDEGKEAKDYNRRAKIFDKSAQVFQALKEENEESPTDSLT